jgi:hypothetical protein
LRATRYSVGWRFVFHTNRQVGLELLCDTFGELDRLLALSLIH